MHTHKAVFLGSELAGDELRVCPGPYPISTTYHRSEAEAWYEVDVRRGTYDSATVVELSSLRTVR